MDKQGEEQNRPPKMTKNRFLKWIMEQRKVKPISSDGYYDLYSSLMQIFTESGSWKYLRNILFSHLTL
jgi:hypothetical protein